MNQKTRFTPFYDWVAEREDLSLLEKLIVCRVLRYGEGGCFESYSSIARAFHVDRRQLIRIVKSLVQKQWLAVLPREKNGRVFYREFWVNPDRFSAGPLFDLPAVKKSKASGLRPPGSGQSPPGSGQSPPEVVVSDHSSIEEDSRKKSIDLVNQSLFEHPQDKIGIDQFWEAYPRKETKQRVVAWFKKNKPSREDIGRMIYTIRQQSSKGGRLYWGEEKHRMYVPLPVTWLDDGDWRLAPTMEDLERQAAEHNRKKQKEENDKKQSIRQEHGSFFHHHTTTQLNEMLTQTGYITLYWLIREIIQERESRINAAVARR